MKDSYPSDSIGDIDFAIDSLVESYYSAEKVGNTVKMNNLKHAIELLEIARSITYLNKGENPPVVTEFATPSYTVEPARKSSKKKGGVIIVFP